MDKLKKILNDNKTLIICTIIPFVIFLVFFLAYYPGIITYDGNNQWEQVQSGIITNSHPFFSTYFMLLLSKIHNTTTGIILFQMIVYSFVWGYFCSIIKTNKKGNIIIIVFTTIISVLPIISLYSISLWKDVLYSYYLFFITVLLFRGIQNKFKYKAYDYVIFGLLLFLISNYRHNGIYVAIMCLILLAIVLVVNRKKIKKDVIKNIAIGFCVFIGLSLIIMIPKKIYLNKSNKYIESTKTVEQKKNEMKLKEKYVLWMLAAHLNDGNITNEKDKDFLSNVADLKSWKKIYDPYLINSIETSKIMDGEFVNNNKGKLLDILLKYTKKHPSTIIKHYLNCDALLIDPFSQRKTYVYVFSFSEWGYYGFNEITNSKLPMVQRNYDRVLNKSLKTSLKYLYQPALVLYLSIIMLVVLSLKVYGRKVYLMGVPMLFNTISLLPINLAQDLRYVYIDFLTFFAILLVLILNYKTIFKRRKHSSK